MTDNVNNPAHYAQGWSNGAEVIDITENLNFNRGNAVKYIARAGKKDPVKELEDLKKAQWYLEREIKRVASEYADKALADLYVVPQRIIFNWISPEYRKRQWESLDEVPAGVTVEDNDGDQYRRISGTGNFVIKFSNGWLPLKEELPNFFLDQHLYKPFTEVLDG